MAASEMWDFLPYATPDYDDTLDVCPSEVILEIATGQDRIIRMYDTSEERLSFYDYPDINIVLKWNVLGDTDAGTIFDWYCNPAKGARTTRSFLWEHPTDGHLYVVRFEDSMNRIRRPADLIDIAEIRLRVLGRGPWGAALDLDWYNYRNNATGAPSTVTVVRASAATYYDYQGVMWAAGSNVLRHDYDPATLEYLGVLIEEARTNLCLQSENLATTWVNSTSTDSVNTITAPDGNLTADTLIEDATAASIHDIFQNIAVTADTVYCISVFLKAKERSNATLRWVDASGVAFGYIQTGAIDLTAGTIGAASADNGGVVTDSGIEEINNGWYRAWISGKFNTTDTDGRIRIFLHNGTSITYDGDGTSGLYVWGAQVEAGAFPTSYIPTTTASVTRNADTITMTGTNFSDWYNQNQSTFFIETAKCAGEDAISLFMVSASAVNVQNSVYLYYATVSSAEGSLIFRRQLSAVAANFFNIPSITTTGIKQCASFENEAQSQSIDGGTVSTNTLTMPSSMIELRIGRTSVNSGVVRIKRITYWAKRLSDAMLKYLTGGAL